MRTERRFFVASLKFKTGMENATLELETPARRVPMTKAQFLAWNPDDGFLYEYENGFALQTTGMKKAERYLIVNILNKFSVLPAYQEGARLLPESDCWLTEKRLRRPDLAFFTREQIRIVSDDEEPIPSFAVELISLHDTAEVVEQKVAEYFTAGVQVLWYVYPVSQMVRVFTSANQSTAYFENNRFSAAPAVPDLSLTVAELLAR